MLGWPDYFHFKGSRLTANNTDTTAKALIRVDNCLVFLATLRALHLYGIEQATVYAYLAAIAIIQIYIGLVATLLPDLAEGKTSLIHRDGAHAAVTAALAAGLGTGHNRAIGPHVKQAGLFNDIV